MHTTREPRKIRRARRAAAFHSERAQTASTPVQRYRAGADALVSAAKHTRGSKTAGALRGEVTEHVHQALEQAESTGRSRELYLSKLSERGTEVQRLGIALMCLQGAINQLVGTERDRLFEHYATHFSSEAQRIERSGGAL